MFDPSTIPSSKIHENTAIPLGDKHHLRETLGGSLRPGDPRRFLIEAMVGAMHADGSIDQREMDAMHALLERHDLFAALPWSTSLMLIEVSTDAISFAGDACRRVGTIADKLPSRTYRLAAYSMACEVCAADESIDESELVYLKALRGALHITEREHEELLQAARNGHSLMVLEAKAARARDMLPVVIGGVLIRKRQIGPLDENSRGEICALLRTLPDIDLPPDVIETAVDRELASQRPRRSIEGEIIRLAVDVPDRADRFWLTVYLLECEPNLDRDHWREVEFFQTLRVGLGLSEDDMAAAEACARAARKK